MHDQIQQYTYFKLRLLCKSPVHDNNGDNCQNEKLRNITKNIFSRHRPWPQHLLLSMRQDAWENKFLERNFSLGKHIHLF